MRTYTAEYIGQQRTNVGLTDYALFCITFRTCVVSKSSMLTDAQYLHIRIYLIPIPIYNNHHLYAICDNQSQS